MRLSSFIYRIPRTPVRGAPPTGYHIDFGYDAWGNLQQTGTWNFQPAFDVNNRISGSTVGGTCAQATTIYCYDLAGKMTWDTATQYTYDAEGHVQTVANQNGTNATYTYDSNGQRIRKDVGSNWTEYLYFGGAVLSEITPSGTTDYIYNNGQIYARASGPDPASTFYYHQDHLGTSKLITDSTGTVVSNCTYAPFGQQVDCSPDDTGNHYRFTGDEYDSESNTHHTEFRQLAGTQGRWLSPDPYLGSIDLTNPQSINRYAYVLNSPVLFTDPSGLSPFQNTSPDTGNGCPDSFFSGCGGSGAGAFDLFRSGFPKPAQT